MVAVRCNKCLNIWLMDGGPDIHSADEEGVKPMHIPVACPYCGGTKQFSLRMTYNTLTEAVAMFAAEERKGKDHGR